MNPDQAIFPKTDLGDGHLWARSGKNVGRRYPIGDGEHTLGRSSSRSIEVEDARASLIHAKIVLVEGRLHLYDLDSTNRTYVNDQRVEEAELRDGDLIQIAETVFE